MSRHVWKEGLTFVEVGYERSTNRFFLTVNNHTTHASTFTIMMVLLKRKLKVPTNLLSVLENDRRLERSENSNLPRINYGSVPNELKDRKPMCNHTGLNNITGMMGCVFSC